MRLIRWLAVAGALLALAAPSQAAVTMQYPPDSDEFSAIGCSGATCLLTGGSETTHGPAVVVMNNGQAGAVQPLSADASPLVAAACASADTCFAVGGNQLYTVTGGNLGQPQPLGDNADVHTISCPGANLCFAGGADTNPSDQQQGAVITISDGQVSSEQFVDGTVDVADLSCPSVSRCVAVGSNANARTGFFTFTDGRPGDFHPLATPDAKSTGITGVDCPTVDRCVAVGLNYAAAITGDTAGRWVQVNGISSLDEFACWAATQCAGTPTDQPDLVAIDSTFQFQADVNLNTPMRAADGVACPSATVCYVVGRSNDATTFGAIATVPTSDLAPVPGAAPARCKVPRLKGLTVAKAKKKLAKAHCKLGKVTRKRVTKKKSKKHVLSQRPQKGSFAAGKKIAVTVGR